MRTNMKNGPRTHRKRVRDWVCCVCSNLNFSFRTHCNRCRVQSKIKNDQDLNRSEGYYPDFKANSDRASTATPSARSQEQPFLLRRSGKEQDQFTFKVLVSMSENDWEGPPYKQPELEFEIEGLLYKLDRDATIRI